MEVKQQLKRLFLKSPFSWPLIAFNAIKENERRRIRKGSNEYIQSLRNREWFKDDPDNTRRYDYDLNENSVVFDIGGYNGEYAASISNKYNCNIFIFEPVPAFYKIIQHKFSHNSKIYPFCFGLSGITTKQSISMHDNASSVFIKDGSSIEIELKNIVEFIDEHRIEKIDLLKLNIEGSEYDLLECLITSNRIGSFHNILVQFHDFIIAGAKDRMEAIQGELSKTHLLTYSYEFVWENWQLKDINNDVES